MTPKNKNSVGPDGLPAPEVGPWAEEKHSLLREYLRFHAHARKKWLLHPRQNGAAYVDLFCGAGMACIEGTDRFVDGSAVLAWKVSVEDGAPFTKVVIADTNATLRSACAQRLRREGAPVVELEGNAIEAADKLSTHINLYGLHMVFLDPFSLGALNFELFRRLAGFHHIDILAHVSAMDLFRNYRAELNGTRGDFDDFAPGWRTSIPAGATDEEGRRAAIDHWKGLVSGTGLEARPELRQVRNRVNRDLYWLMLIAGDKLAGKFWNIVLKYDQPQGTLF